MKPHINNNTDMIRIIIIQKYVGLGKDSFGKDL